MKRILFFSLVLLAVFSLYFASAATFNLDKRDYNSTAIVCPNTNLSVSFSAQELQKHLELITGCKFPIIQKKDGNTKVFYVGVVPANDKKPLQPEESRYLITANAVYLYGEDNISINRSNDIETITDFERNRTGTLFAVYNFLENELGIHWIEPGDGGICYVPSNKITLKSKSNSWLSHFTYQRGFRVTDFLSGSIFAPLSDKTVPNEFKLSVEQAKSKEQDTMIWLKRMRMGSRNNPLPFGHAFNEWWGKYGKTHPEYFALNGNGVRGPVNTAERIKMCPSNMGLAKQIVEDWWAEKQAGRAGDVFSICENDGDSASVSEEFCNCDNCKALDFLEPGEEFGANLTDRYVYLWNNVIKLAREKDPNASPSVYAYSYQLNPPRKLKVDSGVVFGFVPYFNSDFNKINVIYEGWRNMGARKYFLRPNDLDCDLGIPLGQEERVFQNFKLAVKYGIVGTDNDTCLNLWTGISGIDYYIIAKGQIDPSKSFGYWEDEYVSMYGNAKEDVKKYFRYWRNEVFQKKLMPTDSRYMEWERVGEYGRKVHKYYTEKDFEITNKYLADASAKKLNKVQRVLINKLIIAGKHNQLSYEAMLANESGNTDKIIRAAKKLLEYRMIHKDDLLIDWVNLFESQEHYDDICGMNKINR